MTQLLVLGAAILAAGPFTMGADEIRSADAVFPLAVIDGWQIVSAQLPTDFSPARYEWNGALVPKVPAAPLPTRDQLKAARQAAVDAITVTVGGKVFDGDETSQGRMARALAVADLTGQKSCTWVLHDNTPAEVTREELAEALALSLQAQAEVWVIP